MGRGIGQPGLLLPHCPSFELAMTCIAIAIQLSVLVAAGTPDAPSSPASAQFSASARARTSVEYHASGGVIWARGRSYKASAGADGFTFVPFLGSAAARTWPVKFELTSLSLGAVKLPLAPTRVRREGDRVTFDRGSVEVRYDLAIDEVEQSFAVAGVAGSEADLVLRVAVESDLVARVDGDGFLFEGPEGAVAFGAATVLDAAGHGLDIDVRLVADEMTFRVPASFIAEAQGVLIIDPVITSLAIDEFGADLTNPDVAFEAAGHTYCVVYEESFAATDVDIYSRTLDATTLAIVDQGYVDLSSTRSTRPKIASNAQSQSFLVAYEREDQSGRIELYARMRSSSTGWPWAPEFALTTFDVLHVRVNHDVGGDSNAGPGPSNYCIVWEKRDATGNGGNSDIEGRLVSANGVVDPSTIGITSSLAINDEQPAISKCTGEPGVHGAWWVAYTDEDAFAPKCYVRAARIAVDGTITATDHEIWSQVGVTGIRAADVSSPYASAFGETVHVSFDYELTGGETSSDLLSIGRSGATVVTGAKSLDLIDVSAAGPNERTALAALSDRVVSLYIDQVTSTADFDLLVSTFEFGLGGEVAVGERRVLLDTFPQAVAASGQMASRASGGDRSSREVLAVWHNEDPIFGGANIYGALLAFPAPVAVGGNVCRGFKNSTGDFGYLTAFGDNSTSALKQLRATHLPSNALGYFLAGPALIAYTPPASQGLLCVGGSIGRYAGSVLDSGPLGRFDFAVDPTAIAQPNGSVSAMIGDSWYFQAWHRDANPAPTSNFTNAVLIGF